MGTDPTPADIVLNDLARTLSELRNDAEGSETLSKTKKAAYIEAIDDVAAEMNLTMTKEYKA